MTIHLLQHLESLQLSLATLAVCTGLLLGSFVGRYIPVRQGSQWQN